MASHMGYFLKVIHAMSDINKKNCNFIKRISVTMLGHKINLRDLNLSERHWIVSGSSVSLLCPLIPGLRESLAGGGGSSE